MKIVNQNIVKMVEKELVFKHKCQENGNEKDLTPLQIYMKSDQYKEILKKHGKLKTEEKDEEKSTPSKKRQSKRL